MTPERERYSSIIAGPRDHEELVSEIYLDGLFIAQLSMENGPDAIELEIADATLDQTMVCRKVELKAFLEAIEFARQRLVGEQP